MDRTERIDLSRVAQDPRRVGTAGGPVVDVTTTAAPTAAERSTDFSRIGYDGPGPLAVAWRDRWWLLVLALLTAFVTYAVSARSAPVYVAQTTMAYPYSGSEAALTGSDSERSRSLRTEAERITAHDLLEQVAGTVGGGIDVETLEDAVQAIPAADADVITVRAAAASQQTAASIADAVATAYRRQVDRRQQRSIENLRQQRSRLERRVSSQEKQLASQLQDAALREDDAEVQASADPAVAASRLALEATVSQLSDVQARLDQVTAQQESTVGRIQVLWPANPSAPPESPKPARNAATMVVLVLMGFATIRWWLADPDPPTIDDAQTAESVLGAPVIAEIPHLPHTPGIAGVVSDHYPQVIDAYRMAAAMSPVRGAILVTPAGAEEGCSDLVINVAAVLSQDGYRVVTVEGDANLGRLHRHPDEPQLGLTDLAAGHASLESCLLVGVTAAHASIGLLPWGTGQTTLPRGKSSGLAHAIDELRVVADLVIVDGPPLASSANALNLAANVDGILLTVTLGTPLAELSRLRARLSQLDRPVLGVVVQHSTGGRRRRRRRVTQPVRWRPAAPHENTE